jgi:non-ribosomal peptide synthase protein (TIGR01720 family)
LLVTAHHLAVDGVSWRILGPELVALLQAPGPGSPGAGPLDSGSPWTDGPAQGTSFALWSRLLSAEAVRPERVAVELPLWERMAADGDALLVPGHRKRGGPRATLTRTFPPDLTEQAITHLPAAFRCGPNEVLLTALATAVARWRGDDRGDDRGGGAGVLVEVEGHGREALSDDVDISGTVGWFTTQYPVRLDAAGDPADALKRIKEQLRAIPLSGLGHGLLRYLNPDTAPELAALPTPDLRFNYLGRFEGELVGMPAAPMAYAVELDAVAQAGPGGTRLVASWSYDADAISEDRVAALAGLWSTALAELAELAGPAGGGGATASDFPLVELTQSQIDALEADLDGDW